MAVIQTNEPYPMLNMKMYTWWKHGGDDGDYGDDGGVGDDGDDKVMTIP